MLLGRHRYPTLTFFTAGSTAKGHPYEGPRDSAGIVSFLTDVVDGTWKPPVDRVVVLTTDNFDEFINKQAGDRSFSHCIAVTCCFARRNPTFLLEHAHSRLLRRSLTSNGSVARSHQMAPSVAPADGSYRLLRQMASSEIPAVSTFVYGVPVLQNRGV
jgi:hypothetical protein